MKSGSIVWLTVASALAITQARAAEPEKQIQCEIRVLRVSDECFAKMCQSATVRAKPTCCDQSECCPKTACCEKQSCGDKSSCCEKSNCCEKPACCPKSCCETSQKSCQLLPATMPSCMVKVLMEAAQSDPRCNVMCCPRVMTFSGQSACVDVNEQRFFATHLKRLNIGGQQADMPINEPFSVGCHMWVRPTVSPDGKLVFMSVDCQMRELERDPAPAFPVTTIVTPTFEGGSRGQPIPFTQFIQQPSFTTRGAHRFAVCGDGQTMVLDCGRSTRVRETDTSVPFLCDLPVVGELFQSKSSEVVTDRVLVFVTPCVRTCEAGEECTLPAPAVEELPLFAQPAMCLPPETLPVAPRPCAPAHPCPCPPAACPAVAAVTQATAAVTAPCGMWMAAPVPPVLACPTPTAPCPTAACPTHGSCSPLARHGQWVPAPMAVVPVAALTKATPNPTCPQVGCNQAESQLVSLMIEYHEACAAGDRTKARNLAAKCIALDPTCFSR